jgi:hypothetical protein
LSIELQARDAFFVHFVQTLKTWDFLVHFYGALDTPEHLRFSIEAVSLAYLSHQVQSSTALAIGREKYGLALKRIAKALQSPQEASQDTIVLASLLLDLFEKITTVEPRKEKSWTSHINGALALVSLRGLDQFRAPGTLRVLGRLSMNCLISCIASATSVPRELNELRDHIVTHLNVRDPKWRLSDIMVEYANLRSKAARLLLTRDQAIHEAMVIDAKLEAFAVDVMPTWQYITTLVDCDSPLVHERRVEFYRDCHVTQTWNVLRLVRILLNEMIIKFYLSSSIANSTQPSPTIVKNANDIIETIRSDICAPRHNTQSVTWDC